MNEGRQFSQWDHTAAIRLTIAQVNAPKGKKYAFEDFHPLREKPKPKTEITDLLVFLDPKERAKAAAAIVKKESLEAKQARAAQPTEGTS